MRKSYDPLFDEGRRRHPILAFLLLFFLLLAVTVAVLNIISNSRVNLVRQSVTVVNLPASMEGFRILHISDLHGLFFGPRQDQIRTTLASVRYDIVCVTGDITGEGGDPAAFLELLSLFDGVPVFFVPGDEDPAPLISAPHAGDSPKADYILAAEARGAVYLDAPVKITRGSGTLWLSPEWIYTLDADAAQGAYEARLEELKAQESSGERDAAIACVECQMEQLQRIREARRQTLEEDVHIALTHHPLRPDAAQALREWLLSDNDSHVRSIALVLAGHYVGGQWRIPGIGAVRVPPGSGLGNDGWLPEDRLAVGLETLNGIPQYISPGLGVSNASGLPPIRLFNTPAVTLITLTARLTY